MTDTFNCYTFHLVFIWMFQNTYVTIAQDLKSSSEKAAGFSNV